MPTSETTGRREEVEITPQMVEAGVQVLWDSGTAEVRLESDRSVVEDIFRAMLQLFQPEVHCGNRQ